jgi:hypothetical protein
MKIYMRACLPDANLLARYVHLMNIDEVKIEANEVGRGVGTQNWLAQKIRI